MISNLIHDEQVVAKVGKNVLYRSELEKVVPSVSPLLTKEDSTLLARKYIISWAMDHLYLDVAEEQLSKEEMDVSAELDAYRKTLIKYRYEQRYINERLDTLVTDEQIENYYTYYKNDFKLSRPLLKIRFLNIMNDSPNKSEILKLMSSDDYEDLARADSLALSSALRYFDQSETWIDARELTKLFGTDYTELLPKIKNKTITVEPQDRGDILVAYICDMIKDGYAPVDYCSTKIKDIIISNRKNSLLKDLEQDLLNNALEGKRFEFK